MAFLLSKPLGRALAALIALVAVAGLWFAWQVHPLTGPGKEVIVTVHAGDSLATVAGEMHAKGVIGSPFAYRIDTTIFGAPTVLPGSYEIRQNSSFAALSALLNQGPNVNVLSVSPGLTLNEIENSLATDLGTTFANRFVRDAASLAQASPFHPNGSLEGLVGPGSYLLTSSETPMKLARKMVTRFDAKATKLGLTPSTTLNGLSAYQLIIAASIVEKEGYYPSNMPRVARVIFNRLKRGGPLQMDATVLYYLRRDGGTVTPAMLQTPEPYNTYLNVGLTPTPICTISKFSINAVLHAPAGTWLYFTLVNKDGQEAFATTFAEQLKNEALAKSRGIG
ncbi:MAG: endolytic transglycosylase MltG [Acidimicrobiales bacterium]